jgi:hypothetical protein
MSIDDWYKNEEDPGWDAPGRDWADDDRPDRGVDNWLDRARPPDTVIRPEPSAERVPSASTPAAARTSPTPGTSVARRSRKPPRTSAKSKGKLPPRWPQIAGAIRAELAHTPDQDPTTLTRALRRRGGGLGGTSLLDVQRVLLAMTSGGLPNPPRQEPVRKAKADKTTTTKKRKPKKLNRNAPPPADISMQRPSMYAGLTLDTVALDRATKTTRLGSRRATGGNQELPQPPICSSCRRPIQSSGACACSR